MGGEKLFFCLTEMLKSSRLNLEWEPKISAENTNGEISLNFFDVFLLCKTKQKKSI